MRSADELRIEREKFRRQAIEYRHEKQRPEAWLCATIVSVLSWALGESASPTIRIKLDHDDGEQEDRR